MVEIKELTADEVELPEEFDTFGSIACMNCNNHEKIKTRYFELNTANENIFIDREIKRIMKKKYNIKDYGCIAGGDKEILTYTECQKCGSTNIFEDF